MPVRFPYYSAPPSRTGLFLWNIASFGAMIPQRSHQRAEWASRASCSMHALRIGRTPLSGGLQDTVELSRGGPACSPSRCPSADVSEEAPAESTLLSCFNVRPRTCRHLP